MKAFTLNFQGVVTAFYIMMALVLIGGFTGMWGVALLALPIFLLGILGLKYTKSAAKTEVSKTPKTALQIETTEATSAVAA